MRVAVRNLSSFRAYYLNWPTIASLLFVAAALIFDLVVGHYADAVGSGAAPLGDLVLDWMPVLDTRFLTSYGFEIIMLVYLLFPVLYTPEKLSYVLKQTALLIILRNITISLTHLPAPAGFLPDEHPALLANFVFNHDLLFSGHVAFPFLAFLMYTPAWIKRFFLTATIVMGFAVLASHVHYAVDVWVAFFFAYASYRLGKLFFEERALKDSAPPL